MNKELIIQSLDAEIGRLQKARALLSDTGSQSIPISSFRSSPGFRKINSLQYLGPILTRRTKVARSLLILVLLYTGGWCVSAQNQQPIHFDPEHQQPVKLVTPDVKAEVVVSPPSQVTGQSRSIRIRTGTIDSVIPLPFQFYQVNTITQGPPGKLVIVGMSGGYIYEVGILDIPSARVVDRLTCYSPAVSPSGYYIAFTKFYGPHFTPSPEDHNLLYVVARSPSENRPSGIQITDDENVGYTMYPPGIGNRKGDNINAPLGVSHSISGYYIWKDAAEYLFDDTTASELSIVSVRIDKNVANVRRLIVPAHVLGATNGSPSRLLAVRPTDETLRLEIANSTSRQISVRSVDFSSVGSVDLAHRPTASRSEHPSVQ